MPTFSIFSPCLPAAKLARSFKAGIFCGAFLALSLPLPATTQTIPIAGLPQNTRYAIWGDSITEATPYPKYIEAYLLMCAGRKDIKVCTFGHSGEMAGGLVSRQTDLGAFNPTLVSFLWGMNDTQYSPYTQQKGDGYDRDTRASLALLTAKGISGQVVVGPPYVDDTFDADAAATATFFGKADPGGLTVAQAQNVTLGHFRDIARQAAVDAKAGFADSYNVMKDAYLPAEKAYGPKYTYGVHVFPNGGLMLAMGILKALACDGQVAAIDVDMKGRATSSPGHKVVDFTNGVLQLESSKYPFCYNYDPNSKTDPSSMATILPYLPFSAELNRFMLKVKNLGAASASVTWGDETKKFTREQLAKGINLAAEFDHTPFDAAFARVMGAIFNKQDYENFMIKGTSNYFGNDNGGNIDANMIAVEEKKDAALKALAVPVPHTIVIVPEGSTSTMPVVTGTSLLYAPVGQLFTYKISALNSPTAFTADNLPAGLALDPAGGQITGTPTSAGTSDIAVTATNAQGRAKSKLTIVTYTPPPQMPAITSAKTEDATVGQAFSYQITATNDPTDYFVSCPSDKGTSPPATSMPPGITYDTKSGLVSGTPTKAGTYTMQVAAMNDGGVGALQTTLTVKDAGATSAPVSK